MSGLTYNLQIDSKFRDVEKYPNPCDFGVTFINSTTGTSVLGQPVNVDQMFSPVQIDPDYLNANLQIQNAELFSYIENDNYIYLSGIMKLQDTGSIFKIQYQSQPILKLPNTIISETGYNIVSLDGFNILENPFLAVVSKSSTGYFLSWMTYLENYTGATSSVSNLSTRSTIRVSPSNEDVIFWAFDFSSSITIKQNINNTNQVLAQIAEPSKGSQCILITGYNISDGSTYKYEAREWGYQLLYSDYSLEKTRENGRFNMAVDEVNNIYLSGNTTTFKPTYVSCKYPFGSGEINNTTTSQFQDHLIYYMTGADGSLSYITMIAWDVENSVGLGSTGTSFITFNKTTSTGSVEYLGRYFIQKDPGAIYQQASYRRFNFLRANDNAYFICAMTDSTRSLTAYESRAYLLNPTGATGTLVSTFGSGPNINFYPSGITSTVFNTDVYTFQRCGVTTGPTGSYSASGGFLCDKLLIHKLDAITNIGQTVLFTGPLLGLTTGSNDIITKPLTRGGLQGSVNDCMIASVVGSDIYLLMFDANAGAGASLIMPIIEVKWDTVTNVLTQYGNVLTKSPTWPQVRGIINYKSGKKILQVSMNSNNTLTYFYDITNLPTIEYITSVNNNGSKIFPFNYVGDNLFGMSTPTITNWNITDINNMKPFGIQYQLGDDLVEYLYSVDNTNSIIGIGGDDLNGWYYYKSQPIISDSITLKQKYVTKNTGQYVQLPNEYTNQVSYTPKKYNNLNVPNFKQKLYLFTISNTSMIVDDITNISYTIQRKSVSLTSFGFQNHPNRPNGLYGTRYNTHIFDDETGIYILFGFYNKIGLYYYNDTLNTITQLYSESLNHGGVVYINMYTYNNDYYAVYVFVNNIIKIFKIDSQLTGFTLITTTSPSAGSFNVTGGAILVYYTLLNKYYLHLIGYASITTYATPRRINSVEITNPYSPIPTPSSNAFLITLQVTASSNGLSYAEDENFNVILYLCQQTRTAVIDITTPTIYNEVRFAPKQGFQTVGYMQNVQTFYNKIDKTRYAIVPYFLNRLYPPNPIYIYKMDPITNPILISSNVVLQDNYNENPVLNVTICQNENKTYASFLYSNIYYSSGASGAYPSGPVPGLGTTGAIGPDVIYNYKYYIYDVSNPEFAGNNQNVSTTINEYKGLPINGSAFLKKFNADGSSGWLSYMGSKQSDPGLFTNISNFILDYSKKYIYAIGGWQESIAFSQNSPSGIYNYFKSENTVYNSFLAKLNIFTGQWIWAIPLIGNLDDFTERLSYQYYNNTELLLMSVFFNSFSLQTYQAINSSLNPQSVLSNIINITNNTSSVSSAIYAFTPNGTIAWSIILFSKIPLTNVYVLDVDSTEGIITVVGISDTQELYCQDSSEKEVQITYSNINSTTQQYIFSYRFTYLGIYTASQRIDFPESLGSLTINDLKTYPSLNKFILPIVFSTIKQEPVRSYNKDGTFAQDITEYSPLQTNTMIVSYKHDSQYKDINNKVYSSIKHLYPSGLNTGTNYYRNYYDYIIGNKGGTTVNNSFSIRDSFDSEGNFYTILNQYIDTSKLDRNFIDYQNTGQFIRPDLNYYRCNLSKTPTNGYTITNGMSGGVIEIDYKNFDVRPNMYITVTSGTGTIDNIPVTYQVVDGEGKLIYDDEKYTLEDQKYVLVNNKNASAYYTYQFYPGSLYKSNYFIIKKLTLTIPNRLIRNSTFEGTRDLNDLPYLYLKIFNQNDSQLIDINNFNLVYDNNINTGTSACFQFPISYAGTTSNFTTLSLDIQPRIKFSFEYYNMRFQLIDPEGDIIQFDPTPYKTTDSVFTGKTVSPNLLNVTVRMQISIST